MQIFPIDVFHTMNRYDYHLLVWGSVCTKCSFHFLRNASKSTNHSIITCITFFRFVSVVNEWSNFYTIGYYTRGQCTTCIVILSRVQNFYSCTCTCMNDIYLYVLGQTTNYKYVSFAQDCLKEQTLPPHLLHCPLQVCGVMNKCSMTGYYSSIMHKH